MNLFYDVGTKAEALSRYAALHKRSVTDYDREILEPEVAFTLQHVLSNSPLPHYAHQSNLAEEQLLYPIVDGVLRQYRATFASSVPLKNATMEELGTELQKQTSWTDAGSAQVTAAYVRGDQVIITVRGEVDVPLTLPAGASASGLEAYGAVQTGWHGVAQSESIQLPAAPGYAQ
jgi:hypothetical protein